MKKYSQAATVFLAVAFAATSCTIRQIQNETRSVSVEGTGIVYAVPDRATVTFSVATSDRDVKNATTQNADQIAAVEAALVGAGIDKSDISTAGYSIYQETGWNEGRRISGNYQVSNEITVLIHDIGRTGTCIDTAIKAGANGLSSIAFGINDPENLKKQARILAVKQAETNAKLLADLSGAKLGKVLTITEEENSPVFPVVMTAAKTMTAGGSAQTPVSAGKTKISVTVHVTYTLQ